MFAGGYPSRCFIGLGEGKPQTFVFSGASLGGSAEPGRTLCELPFSRGERLFIYSERDAAGSEAAGHNGQSDTRLQECILSQITAPVDQMAESIWRDLKPEAGDGREQDAVLLGLELP